MSVRCEFVRYQLLAKTRPGCSHLRGHLPGPRSAAARRAPRRRAPSTSAEAGRRNGAAGVRRGGTRRADTDAVHKLVGELGARGDGRPQGDHLALVLGALAAWTVRTPGNTAGCLRFLTSADYLKFLAANRYPLAAVKRSSPANVHRRSGLHRESQGQLCDQPHRRPRPIGAVGVFVHTICSGDARAAVQAARTV
jgi:hypothetical protein